MELWRSGITGFIDEWKAGAGEVGDDAGRRWTFLALTVALGG